MECNRLGGHYEKTLLRLSVAILSFTAVNVAAAGDFCSDPGFVRDRENGLFAFTPGNSGRTSRTRTEPASTRHGRSTGTPS